MAALSDNKKDVYVWIWKVIRSCRKEKQLPTCEKLVILFEKQYNDIVLTDTLLKEIRKMQ